MKKKKKSKKTLGIESSIWRSFMKTESTTQKPTVNKSPIFQSCIIFIAAYFLVIRIIYTLAFLFCFRLVFSFDFLSVFFSSILSFPSVCARLALPFQSFVFLWFFETRNEKKKKHTPKISVCISSILWWLPFLVAQNYHIAHGP